MAHLRAHPIPTHKVEGAAPKACFKKQRPQIGSPPPPSCGRPGGGRHQRTQRQHPSRGPERARGMAQQRLNRALYGAQCIFDQIYALTSPKRQPAGTGRRLPLRRRPRTGAGRGSAVGVRLESFHDNETSRKLRDKLKPGKKMREFGKVKSRWRRS